MNRYFCSQEETLAVALREGRWPQACDPELRAHVDVCRYCRDLALVAEALQQARAETEKGADLAAPGTLWWRAQLRRRNQAIERMNKPIAVAEKLGLFTMMLAIFGLVVWQWDQIAGWMHGPVNLSEWETLRWDTLLGLSSAPAGWMLVLLLVALGTLIFFGGCAMYFVAQKE